MIRLALRELRRRPRRFAGAGTVLTLVMVLLVFLGGLLDGLFLGSTGAIRAQDVDVLTYSRTARDQFLRSRIDSSLRRQVEATPGVTASGGLGVTLVGARIPGRTDLADAAVIGYQLTPHGIPAPPPPGWAWADRRLRAAGAHVGDVLKLGPRRIPVKVKGFVLDSNYLLQGGLWVAPATWRAVQNTSLADGALGPGVFQVLAVRGDGRTDAAALAAAIDAQTAGRTSSLTREEAVFSLPGTRQQNRTFTGIIGATIVVAVLVVALFFVLLTLERVALYGMLKAVGASSAQLFAGVLVQALVVAMVAALVGAAIAVGLAELMPDRVPVHLEGTRVALSGLFLVLAAGAGCGVSLRRVVRIDPAAAIGRSR